MNNLELARDVARYCQFSRRDILARLDYATEHNGLYLGFKRSPTGRARVAAVAHMDYLGSGKVHRCDRRRVVSSALDDRLGVWLALNLEALTGIPLDIIITDGEESGQSTARYVSPEYLDRYNWIVEFDRMGLAPVVYCYECMREPLLECFVSVGAGSYTDICEWGYDSRVGAYNHGIGYHDQHTERCSVKVADIRRSIDNFVAVYQRIGNRKIAHDPETWADPWKDDFYIEELNFDREFEERLASWSDPWEDDMPDGL